MGESEVQVQGQPGLSKILSYTDKHIQVFVVAVLDYIQSTQEEYINAFNLVVYALVFSRGISFSKF